MADPTHIIGLECDHPQRQSLRLLLGTSFPKAKPAVAVESMQQIPKSGGATGTKKDMVCSRHLEEVTVLLFTKTN